VLLSKLREILGLDRQWRVCVVGVGRLGQAIAEYGGFEPQGFQIVAAFDSDPEKVGSTLGKTTVRNSDDLEAYLRQNHIDIGVVAVPAHAAQSVTDRLVNGGIRAILNYAPMTPHVPRDVTIRHIDPVLAMQSMTFYIKKPDTSGK
jgi:redox-sensing transcriptional repressor